MHPLAAEHQLDSGRQRCVRSQPARAHLKSISCSIRSMPPQNTYDDLLVDTAPGIDDNVLYLNSAAQEILVVVTPDPTSLTDAYALIKVLNQRHRENRFSVVTNMVKDEQEARFVFQKLSDVASRFLCISLDYRGFIPNDLILRQSIRATSSSASNSLPGSPRPASIAISRIGTKPEPNGLQSKRAALQFFWQPSVRRGLNAIRTFDSK